MMILFKLGRFVLLASACMVTLLVLPTTARATGVSGSQGSSDEGLTLQEVIVTAQKREEKLHDVPVDVLVVSSADLLQRQVTSIDDLMSVVPGLSIESDGWQRKLHLRGVSNDFGTQPLVATYVDEADLTSTPAGALTLNSYDLQRVEVLRGPQGTLFGNSAAGGVIRFVTNDPDLRQFSMDADVAAMFTEGGEPGQRVEAMVNTPVTGTFGLRFSGIFEHDGGWVDQPAAERANINSQDLTDVRAKALWQPIEGLSVSALADVHRSTSGTPNAWDKSGNYEQVFSLTNSPRVEDNFNLYDLTVTYDFGSFKALNTTSYVYSNLKATNFGYEIQYTPPGTPAYDVLENPWQPIAKIYNEELRFESAGSAPWQWMIGAVYRHADFALNNAFLFAIPGPPGSPLPPPFPSSGEGRSKSRAIFGNSSYNLTDRITVGAGIRYFVDDQDDVPSGQSATFHSVDPRFYAQFKFSDQVNVYASAAKGFRSGGFNSFGQPAFEPENIWTYEIGNKNLLLDGHLSINTAVFYTDYKDFQIPSFGVLANGQLFFGTTNAGAAKIEGIDLDAVWKWGDWSLSANGEYLHDYFYQVASNANYVVGQSLDNTPNYSFTVSAKRDFMLLNRPAFARLDYGERAREAYSYLSIGPWYYGQSDVIRTLNLNTGLQWSESLSLHVFAQNLLNDQGIVFPLDDSIARGYAIRPRPRTYGLEFTASFK